MQKNGVVRIKKRVFINDVLLMMLSNIVNFLSGLILTFVLPKFIGEYNYGYYQLYIFYAGYVGIFGFGWIEGIYLRYGGLELEKVDKKLVKGQLIIFSIMECVISIVVSIGAYLFSSNIDERKVLLLIALNILIYMPRAFLHNLYQTTDAIKDYAVALIVGRITFFAMTLIYLFSGRYDFCYYIYADLIGKGIAAIYIFIKAKNIISVKTKFDKEISLEIKKNISSGIKILIANLASMLVLGTVRMGIEQKWSIETFGQISLTFSCSNFMMLFINSIALVFFPNLKRLDEKRYSEIYVKIKPVLMFLILIVLIFYFPMYAILIRWMPQYKIGLDYMAILFPMCLFESEMAILNNTYLKALGKEKKLLSVNILTLIISCFFTIITVFVLENIFLAVLSIVILLAIRSMVAESMVKKCLEIRKNNLYSILEIMLVILFIFVAYHVKGINGFALYFVGILVSIIIIRKDLVNSIKYLKRM